jgi:sugar/nucleoside kinase (ribokinase family)
VCEEIGARGIETGFIRRDWPLTARTVVLVDAEGHRRCINDPRMANEYRYPEEDLEGLMQGCEWVLVSTQSWCRHAALHAVTSGRRVAVDAQAITGVDDYHRDFLDRAHVVILSTERLGEHSHDLIRRLWAEHDVEVVVATHGAGGATLGVRASGTVVWEPAHDLRPVIDRTGAGDAFFAGLMSAVLRGCSWRKALTAGQLVAGWVIGEHGSSRGHPSAARLEELLSQASCRAGSPEPEGEGR